MAPFQERVKVESAELDARIEKLANFLEMKAFRELDPAEQERLRCQLDFMVGYAGVLARRIAAFR